MSFIEPGRKAPAFSLNDQHGQPHSLAAYTGRPVVLYFYPKDDTPGCTAESCSFQDNLPKFTASGETVVLGVSILDEKSKAKFAKKHNLTFPLLADPEHAVAEKYGVWQEKSRYGRKYFGIVRTTYLIGADGTNSPVRAALGRLGTIYASRQGTRCQEPPPTWDRSGAFSPGNRHGTSHSGQLDRICGGDGISRGSRSAFALAAGHWRRRSGAGGGVADESL